MRFYVESQEDSRTPVFPLCGEVPKQPRKFVSAGKGISLSKENM